MRRLMAAAAIGLACAMAHAQVLDLNPTAVGVYTWNTTTNQFVPVPNSSSLEAFPTTPQAYAFYGLNTSLGQWTPCVNGSDCLTQAPSNGTNQTQSNTGVLIASSQPGSSYSSPSFAESGGACAVAPTLGYDTDVLAIHGVVFPYITNPASASCTTVPTVTVNDPTGTGATVILEVQPSWPTINEAGLFNGVQTQNGGGEVLGTINPIVARPFEQDPTLEPIYQTGNEGGMESLDCGGLGTNRAPWLYLQQSSSIYGLQIFNPCAGPITISPYPRNSVFKNQAVTLGPSLVSDSYFQLTIGCQTVTSCNGEVFNPGTSSMYSLAQPVGWDFVNSNTGGVVNAAELGGGNGYTNPGSCAISGGTLATGSADTCTTSLTASGGILIAVVSNGTYSVQPRLTISGASGGASAITTGQMFIQNPNSLNVSLWVDVAGELHFSTAKRGVTGSDVWTVSKAGVITINGNAGVSCTGTPTSSFASVNGLVTHC